MSFKLRAQYNVFLTNVINLSVLIAHIASSINEALCLCSFVKEVSRNRASHVEKYIVCQYL